jgi:hypothetical protein
VVSAASCRIPSLRPDGGCSECAHRNARGCRSGPVRERGPGRPMAGATASLSRQSYAQGRGRRNRTFHKGAWALTQAACSRSSLSAAQWRVGKGEIAVERRSRGRTSDSRARRRICDAEYFCDTNLACRRGRSCPNRVKLRRTQLEQMFSGVLLRTDIARRDRHVANVPDSDIIRQMFWPAPLESALSSGRAHRIQELADLELQSVAVG